MDKPTSSTFISKNKYANLAAAKFDKFNRKRGTKRTIERKTARKKERIENTLNARKTANKEKKLYGKKCERHPQNTFKNNKSIDQKINKQHKVNCESGTSSSINPDKCTKKENKIVYSHFISPNKVTNVSTFNCRTLKANWKQMELINYCIKKNISILSLQEHSIYFEQEDPIKKFTYNNWYFYLSSATNKGNGGVGFLISPQAHAMIDYVKTISSRIISIQISSTNKKTPFKTNITNVYSPTSCSELPDIEIFYNNLNDHIKTIPIRNLNIILGDFNANVVDNINYSYEVIPNRNSEHFNNFINNNNLFPINMNFIKKNHEYITFYGPNNRKVTLDYILINKKWLSSAKNIIKSTPSTISSDHAILTAIFKWTLSKKKTKRNSKKDWNSLKDLDIKKSFTQHIINNNDTINDEIIDINEVYNKYIDSIKDASIKFIPNLPIRSKRIPWEDNDIINVREKLITAKIIARSNKNNIQNNTIANNLSLELAELYKSKQEIYYLNKCKDIQELRGDNELRESWQLINIITGRKCRNSGIISANSSEERIILWYEHFKKLLSCENNINDLNNCPNLNPIFTDKDFTSDQIFNTDDIDIIEIKEAVKYMSNNKAVGLDEISAEILKLDELHPIFCIIMNNIYNSNITPKLWKESLLIPVFKKGNISDCNNYRGIALMSVFAKLFNRILLMRIRSVLDSKLRINQNGFRPGRSTTQQILAMKRIIEICKTKKDKNLVAVFIDFSKAFDSVKWNYIKSILISYNIPIKLVNAIMSIYDGATAKVCTNDGISDNIDLNTGVLQGDTLAPYIFVIVIDYILRNALNDITLGFKYKDKISSRYPAKYITDLAFADDISLLSSDIDDVQIMINNIESIANVIGLKINKKKTEFILVGTKWNYNEIIKVKDGNIIRKDDFKYLGSWIMNDKKEFLVRKAIAWKQLSNLKKIWISNMSNGVKYTIFQSTILSILLYGSETWSINAALSKSIDGTYTNMLRYIFNIHWSSHTCNIVLYKNANNKNPLSKIIQYRRNEFAGHCYRCKDSQYISDLILLIPNDSYILGQGSVITYPKLLLKDSDRSYLANDIKNEIDSLKKDMNDRIGWRKQNKERLNN